MKALISSRPRRGSWSEYFNSMSGAASSSTTDKVALLTPEIREPPTDNGLVVFLFAHRILSFVSRGVADRGR